MELLQKSVAKQHIVKWTTQSIKQQRNGHISGKGFYPVVMSGQNNQSQSGQVM